MIHDLRQGFCLLLKAATQKFRTLDGVSSDQEQLHKILRWIPGPCSIWKGANREPPPASSSIYRGGNYLELFVIKAQPVEKSGYPPVDVLLQEVLQDDVIHPIKNKILGIAAVIEHNRPWPPRGRLRKELSNRTVSDPLLVRI